MLRCPASRTGPAVVTTSSSQEAGAGLAPGPPAGPAGLRSRAAGLATGGAGVRRGREAASRRAHAGCGSRLVVEQLLAVATAARPGEVHIHVRDSGGPDAPFLSASEPDAEHGRGLAIVDALATDWGSYATSSGQTTWARITPDRHAHPGPRVPEREAG